VLIVFVVSFGGLLVDLFIVEILAFEVVDAVVEHVGIVAGFEVAFCDGGEEAFANLSKDIGWELFMVGQRGLYSTWRHGHGVWGLGARWWDWERCFEVFDG
jgi:hypothetical protein